jgi:Spy/CpxP family protein refolding chaperone
MITLKKIIAICLFISVAAMGQEKERREKIKALMVGYITNEISLTSTEAEKFWPIYNEFENKQFEIRFKKIRPLRIKIDRDNLSEKETQNLLYEYEKYEEELHQNRKKLHTSLANILTPNKLLKLKLAEESFNKKLLQHYKKKMSKKEN